MSGETPKRLPIARALSHRNFAIFEGGLFPSYLSGWMQRVGAGWLAWELTHSPVWLGIIAAADLAPMLVLAPLAGAWTDRVNPLPLIRIAQALLLLQAVLMSLLTATGWMTIEVLLVLTIYSGLVYPFHSTARQSIIPATVAREDFAPAIALDSASFHSTRFIGPAIAAFIIPAYGVQGTFFSHVLGSTLCLTTFLMLRLKPPDRSQSRGRNLFAQVADSLSYAAGHGGLRPMLLLLAFTSTFVRPLQDMLPGFAGDVFHGGPRELAWLSSSVGIGAMAGAIYIAMRGSLAGLTRVTMVGYCGTGLAALGFVATNNLWIGVLCCAGIGFFLNVMSTSIQSLMQFAAEDSMRGRVMSLYLLIYRGMPAVGAVIIGFLASTFSLRIAGGVAAGICLIYIVSVLPKQAVIANSMENPPPRRPAKPDINTPA
ncbi:MFS transporter [Roseiarcaceae bacterium H3SJ34-1]|uniref:MFS transporter n=1 Tax=Terripilifer ovatus TaxID=3032367 RepID=UPI003AB9AEC8|nr:MFS transporter [Roseiarcaceae bacterium H3SJ34-1]